MMHHASEAYLPLTLRIHLIQILRNLSAFGRTVRWLLRTISLCRSISDHHNMSKFLHLLSPTCNLLQHKLEYELEWIRIWSDLCNCVCLAHDPHYSITNPSQTVRFMPPHFEFWHDATLRFLHCQNTAVHMRRLQDQRLRLKDSSRCISRDQKW